MSNVYTDVSTLQVVHAALRDRGLGHAGVQQHQQLPGLRAGGQDYGIIYTGYRGLLLICSSSGQVNTVSAGVCDYLYGRDVDSTGKFCAGGAVDACQVSGGWTDGLRTLMTTVILRQLFDLIDGFVFSCHSSQCMFCMT